MPPQSRNLLDLTIAGTLAAFLISLVLAFLFMRLDDDPALVWATRAAYGFAILLVIALACGHFGRVKREASGSREIQ